MSGLQCAAAKQLGSLDARIAQLRDEYDDVQFAEMIARRAGSKEHAEQYRLRSRILIGTLSYLVDQRWRIGD